MHPVDAKRLLGLVATWEAAIGGGLLSAWCVSRGREGQWVLVVIEVDGVEHDGSGATLAEAMIALGTAIQASENTTTLPGVLRPVFMLLPDLQRAPPGERPS